MLILVRYHSDIFGCGKNYLILSPNMRADLSYYIASPSHLDEVSITELEHSISEQPFNQTLKMLLAKKTFGSSERLLQDAVISSTERNFLKLKLLDYTTSDNEVPLNVITADDTFKIDTYVSSSDEYDYLVSEDQELENFLEESESAKITTITSALIEEENVIKSDSMKHDSIIHMADESEFSSEPNNYGTNSDEIDSAHDESDTSIKEVDDTRDVNIPENSDKAKKKKKTKKVKKLFKLDDYSGTSDYVLWLCSLSGKDVKTKKKQKKKSKIDETVKRSITKSDTIISEPLADLLASQGHSADAIKMYDQLILKFPEKSVYFAAKIDKILKSNTE